MSIIWAILIGIAVALGLKLLVPGKEPGGFAMSGLMAVAGSLLVKYVGEALGWYKEADVAELVACLIGAIVFLLLFRWSTGRTSEDEQGRS